MKTIAQSDALTKLYNRAFTEKQIIQYFSQGNTAGVMMILDIDNFKRINDNRGHLCGDRILIRFSQILSEVFPGEIIGRIGGDEFLIFAKGNFTQQAISQKADQIIRKFDQSFLSKDPIAPATCSIGISRAPLDGGSFPPLFDKADRALYHVKRSGKHGFCFYGKNFAALY